MKTKTVVAAACASMLGTLGAWALPTLQLDVPGGVYNTIDETTYATTPNFTLRALYGGSDLTTTFYISAAIVPGLAQSSPPPNIGSFTIDGVTITTATMNWGTPPVDVLDNQNGGGPGNLGSHSIYPTYYAEVSFTFDAAHHVPAYNTADGTTANGDLFYHDFNVDVSGLLAGYAVHFDLYDEAVKKGSPTLDDFAPFSHDAQSGGSVPDNGSTLLLLGAAMLGTCVIGRRVRGLHTA